MSTTLDTVKLPNSCLPSIVRPSRAGRRSAFAGLLRPILFTGVLLFVATTVSAASYNPEELGKASGPYLYPIMLIDEFQRAGCGNAFRKNYDVNAAIAEIKATLSPAHVSEVDEIVPPIREEAKKFVKVFFVVGAKDNVDKPTLCGMATGVVLPLKQSGDSKWESAKTRYRYR